MRKEKFLIACDLDGTLLKDYQEITEYSTKIIKEIVNQGHIFCLVTGRPYRGSYNFYNQLKLDTIMVNQNGSYITNPSDEKFVPIIQTFQKRICYEILNNQKIKSFIKNALIEGVNKGWLLNKITDEETKQELFEMFHLRDRDIIVINNKVDEIDTDISSILLHIDEKDFEHFNVLLFEIKKIAPTLVVRNWSLKNSGNIIEINSDFASKRNALKFLSSYYGIPKENCIALGDGDNDASMLDYATWGFAMKNASQSARLAARYMTSETSDNDGVVKQLVSFLKLNI